MQSSQLVSAFAEIAHEKDINRDALQVIIEDVFRAMITKRYGADDAFDVILNPDKGDVQIVHIREVVADYDLEDPVSQIELSDALTIEDDYEVEDEVAETIEVADFGRRAVQIALQTFRQKIRDIEKENIYREYSELIGEIVVGEIYQTRRREVLVIHNKTEMLLPRSEQIPKDRYRKGDMLRAVVKEVIQDAGNSPQVIISRTDPVFVERLFELEVPEIYDGIVELKKVVRLPGERAKMGVVSHDERVDPIGACVGVKGSRIQQVVRELGGENIDVVLWTDSPQLLVERALSPANPIAIELNEELEPPRARVTVPADEVSLAIGRGGQNIRLASKITGYEIDVYREIGAEEEDVDIDEFADAIPVDMIERMKDIGCDTAKAVLELSAEELSRRTELPLETTQRILILMEAEFSQREEEDEGSERTISEGDEGAKEEVEPAAEGADDTTADSDEEDVAVIASEEEGEEKEDEGEKDEEPTEMTPSVSEETEETEGDGEEVETIPETATKEPTT